MEHRIRVNLFSAAGVIALGIVVSAVTSTVVAARAYQSRVRQIDQADKQVTVKGSARTRVRSDLAVWEIAVSGEGKSLQEAYAVLEAGTGRVRGFLKSAGFADGEVIPGAIDTRTFFTRDSAGRETREVSGYALEQGFTTTSPEVDRAFKAATEVTALIKDGILISSSRPNFYYSKVADLKVQILGEASRDARARADEIARNAGGHVAGVRSAQMGVVQITRPNSTDVSSYGLYDTSSIDKDVSVVVTLTFAVED